MSVSSKARESPSPAGNEPFDYLKLRQDLALAVAKICPGWMSDRREDLVQAAVIRVMARVNSGELRGEGDPHLTTSYLYKAAYSALIDEIRRVRRRRETPLEDEQLPELTGSRDPERLTASQEIGRGIEECLSRMKRERRLAVTLHLQGHNVPEAARILDWPAKRTENLVYRGMADLRACLLSKGIRP